jgi:hypothetical protein
MHTIIRRFNRDVLAARCDRAADDESKAFLVELQKLAAQAGATA